MRIVSIRIIESRILSFKIGHLGQDAGQNENCCPYLDGVDLVGIRDYDVGLPWVPCASCMHPEFDRPRSPKHEVVVFSHKKFRLNIKGLPTFTNKEVDFRAVLDFLGSGETILTSSFHGAYWGTLLGRKVLAFPFSSKFFWLKAPSGDLSCRTLATQTL